MAAFATSARADLTLKIADYATAPMTGTIASPTSPPNASYLARLNFLAEEPGAGRNRLFVNDLNGPLYILDQTTKAFTPYLNLNGQSGQPGMFRHFVNASGFANGFITFQFDPDYANNGKFYTVHMEEPASTNLTPANAVAWGLDATGYTTTTSFVGAGNDSPDRRTVLIEWTDSNINNSTFQGTARELMRVDMYGQAHPMGDLIFNPTAGPGDPDWRVMYISVGDGGAGERTESSEADERRTPQQFNAPGGKVLRILPDLAMHASSSVISSNGRYRIPDSNPFVAINGDTTFGDEVFAMGFRNPHRMSWDVDPENPANNHLLVDDIGLFTWEEVNIVHAGGNYGYSQREGNQRLFTSNGTGPIPNPDVVTTQFNNDTEGPTATPLYPVVQYGHGRSQPAPEGDSITSGYVYRGTNIPSLHGKYIFGDITTGQLFWSDFADMLAADDGNPATLAAIHQIDVLWDNPNTPAGFELYETRVEGSTNTIGPMFDVIERMYENRGGLDDRLPGSAAVTGDAGRADIRWQIDEAGELFLLSKSDGMIRYLVEAVGNANFNGVGGVDGTDFMIWQRNLGKTGATLADGDADGDGLVTQADLGFWQRQFETSSESASVPEPASAALLFIGLAMLRRRRV